MTLCRLHSGLRVLRVTGSTRLELEEDLFQRWNITSLTVLHMSQNNATKIWQRTSYSLTVFRIFNCPVTVQQHHKQMSYYNTPIVRLSLTSNGLTDIHLSTFQTNMRLSYLDMTGDKITSLYERLFKKSVERTK